MGEAAIHAGNRGDYIAPKHYMGSRRPVVRVIDDDSEMRKSLAWLFETSSLEVESYASFMEFKDQLDLRTPGCLILDLKLAGENGIEVLQSLSSDPEFHLPVIILTGHGAMQEAIRCMKLGAIDFLEKPVDSEVMLARVQEAIDADIRRCCEWNRIMTAHRRLESLTARERKMIDLIGQGLSSKQIARTLELSVKTVANRRARVMAKVGASNAPELVTIVATAQASHHA